MKRQWTLLLAAVQYFTRLPVPGWVGHSQQQLDDAARYFPLVGTLVGALGAAVYLCASWFWPSTVAVLLSVAATAWITGAFHEDGLADSIDGLGGAFTRERALEIMRDSRIGTFGALALILVIALKLALLIALPVSAVPWLLLVAHTASRAVAVGIMRSMRYARDDDSRAKPLVNTVSGVTVAIALLTVAISIGLLALGGSALLLAGGAGSIAAVGAGLLWGRKLSKRLGGYTGDGLGAAQQFAELAFYLAALGVLR